MGIIQRNSKRRNAMAKQTAGGPSVVVTTAADIANAARRVELNICNNAELRANSKMVLSIIHTNRPKNTIASYNPKQREFQAFCQRKQYHP